MDCKKRNIFVINEDEACLKLIIEPLLWEGFEVKGFTSYEQFAEAVRFMKPHLVIINPEFSGYDGSIVFNEIFPSLENCSVVVVSPQATTDKITKYLDLGASDFISFPFVPLEFLARIRNQFRILDMTHQLVEANQKLKTLIEIDDLTGLFNMRSVYQKLEFEIARARRFSRTVTVVMMDMDKFKSVNDGHDHLFGSYVISEVGRIIRQLTRTVDIPARYGGDEFLIVLAETPQAGVDTFCEKLRKKVEDTLFEQGIDSIKLTISIGYATMTEADNLIPAKELVRRADMALYESKRNGRNQVQGYKPEFDRIQAHIEHSKKRGTA